MKRGTRSGLYRVVNAKILHFPFLLLLAAARTSHADAVADFTSGTAVRVAAATVDLGDGPRSSSGSAAIAKRSGTLDFTLQASDLGVTLPLTVHLRGSTRGGGWIEYTINDVYSPPVKLGDGHSVSSVTGHLYMLALPLPGRASHEVGNVRLLIAGASNLIAYGDWGKVPIEITKLDLLGGVAQPPLDSFVDPTRLVICSNKVASAHTFALSLVNVAKATGAAIELKTPRDAGVRLPSGIVVPAGRRSATVTARIEPNFVGRVRLTAAAGGVARSLDLVVHPLGDCPRR